VTDARYMALDVGTARTGVAVADPTGTVVRPLEPVEKVNTSDGMARLLAMISEHDVSCVVVGLPLGLDGRDTAQTSRTRSFAGRLRRAAGVRVELHDERYTTRMADATARVSGSESSRDSLAACHLLTSYLESRRS
jgi:putative Holliday junction resolvase